MIRQKALKAVLVVFGLLFTAGVYPLVGSVRDNWHANKESAEPMFISLYVALGVFLLFAARNPSPNRSLIAYGAWSSFAHGTVMAVMSIHLANERKDLLIAAAVFSAIGGTLLALLPAKQSGQRTSSMGA